MFVNSVSPTNVMTGQTAEMWVNGLGFTGQVGIAINGIFIPTYFVSDTVVKFVLPYIPAGTYDITVINGDNDFTTWVVRTGITITDPAVGTGLGTLGGPAFPIVLPPVVVESACTAVINGAVDIRNYTSSALVYPDPFTGETTATKSLNSSGVPTEPVVDNASSTQGGTIVESPFGTFQNPL